MEATFFWRAKYLLPVCQYCGVPCPPSASIAITSKPTQHMAKEAKKNKGMQRIAHLTHLCQFNILQSSIYHKMARMAHQNQQKLQTQLSSAKRCSVWIVGIHLGQEAISVSSVTTSILFPSLDLAILKQIPLFHSAILVPSPPTVLFLTLFVKIKWTATPRPLVSLCLSAANVSRSEIRWSWCVQFIMMNYNFCAIWTQYVYSIYTYVYIMKCMIAHGYLFSCLDLGPPSFDTVQQRIWKQHRHCALLSRDLRSEFGLKTFLSNVSRWSNPHVPSCGMGIHFPPPRLESQCWCCFRLCRIRAPTSEWSLRRRMCWSWFLQPLHQQCQSCQPPHFGQKKKRGWGQAVLQCKLIVPIKAGCRENSHGKGHKLDDPSSKKH